MALDLQKNVDVNQEIDADYTEENPSTEGSYFRIRDPICKHEHVVRSNKNTKFVENFLMIYLRLLIRIDVHKVANYENCARRVDNHLQVSHQ